MNTFKTPKGTQLPLRSLHGKDYLEVKHRLIWFREEKPDWSIETEFVSIEKDSACAKATVKDQSGRIIATSHKFEDVKGFADFREKAETGAVGRALALIGYGTQFAEELDEGERIVDSPVERKPSSSLGQTQDTGSVRCSLCSAEMLISKAGTSYYCPNFKDTSRGDHPRVPLKRSA